MEKNFLVEWAITQGLHVTGSKTPYEFINKISLYTTKDISDKIPFPVIDYLLS